MKCRLHELSLKPNESANETKLLLPLSRNSDAAARCSGDFGRAFADLLSNTFSTASTIFFGPRRLAQPRMKVAYRCAEHVAAIVSGVSKLSGREMKEPGEASGLEHDEDVHQPPEVAHIGYAMIARSDGDGRRQQTRATLRVLERRAARSQMEREQRKHANRNGRTPLNACRTRLLSRNRGIF